ncbi:MAG: hypothetical protein WCZ18_12660 [Ottowia sp.]|nr:hypothetical protein [Ottowia sp.]
MLRQKLMWIIWPAFVAAGVLEMMTFAVLDPLTLALFGEPVSWSRQTIYSVTFLIYWLLFAACSAVTLLLARAPGEVNRGLPHPASGSD